MKFRISIVTITSMIILSSLSFQSVNAAELTANINPQNPESQFTAKYYTTVQIQYDEGGKLQDILKDKRWTIRKNVGATDSYTADMTSRLNQKLSQDGSDARVSDLSVMYQAELRGQSRNASIDYTAVLSGTLSDYVITKDTQRTLIDMGWKGIILGQSDRIRYNYGVKCVSLWLYKILTFEDKH